MRRPWWIGLAGLVAATTLAILLQAGEEERPTPLPSADATVTVSVDRPVRTRGSMNGFIHALGATQPADEQVAPLAPRLWRSEPSRAPIERATALGARYQLVLSDLWGYPQSGWNGRGPPWRNLPGWERFVRDTARTYRGQPVSWDIWNEPNDPGFWSGGRQRFFEVYSRANRVLRSELGPHVEIAGPSTSRYAPVWLTEFLGRCLAARCRVSALSWHENLDADDPLHSISAHLADGRRRFLAQPRYAPLGLREIHINEFVGRSDRNLPGEAVAYLEQLEGGGADRAARSCWTHEDCSATGLDGLLEAASGMPRASWWVHRWYAEGADSRVEARSRGGDVFALASASGGRAQVLIGRASSRRGSSSPSIRVAVRVRGSTAGEMRVRAERVVPAGEAAVPRPAFVLDRRVRSEGGGVAVVLPLPASAAMRVTLDPR